MSGTGWMVLNQSQDEVLHRTSSALDAFRMARRAGGKARLERAGPFRVVAIGTSRSLVVVRLATLDADPATGQTPDARERVAIPVGDAPTAEIVSAARWRHVHVGAGRCRVAVPGTDRSCEGRSVRSRRSRRNA